EPRRPGGAMSTPRERRTYVVKAGDNLYNISREVYGDGGRYKEILQANRATLPSASQLQPGMSLIIP
ncbi:MAG: nucleoid-associated protein YgaU, partial [Candidatus Pelagisphaera sp.]